MGFGEMGFLCICGYVYPLFFCELFAMSHMYIYDLYGSEVLLFFAEYSYSECSYRSGGPWAEHSVE